jgi:hypothetical protein
MVGDPSAARFLVGIARDPNALAIIDGDVHLSYRDWYGRISALVGPFQAPAPLCIRRDDSKIAGRQAPATKADRG